MPEAKTYQGGCHCGKVNYAVTTDLAETIACNCSICTKRGIVWTFVSPPQFTLQSLSQAPLTAMGHRCQRKFFNFHLDSAWHQRNLTWEGGGGILPLSPESVSSGEAMYCSEGRWAI